MAALFHPNFLVSSRAPNAYVHARLRAIPDPFKEDLVAATRAGLEAALKVHPYGMQVHVEVTDDMVFAALDEPDGTRTRDRIAAALAAAIPPIIVPLGEREIE